MRPLSPNLAPSEKPDLDKIQYPTLCSEKFDGCRTVIMDGVGYSRTWKPLHQSFQIRFKPFLDKTKGTDHVFDCEVYNPDADFNEITSSLAHLDGIPLKLYIFDYLTKEEWYGTSVTPFAQRIDNLVKVIKREFMDLQDYFEVVEQKACSNRDEISEWYDEVIAQGGEGLMLRDPCQLYKHGRSTAKATPEKGGGFWKLKAFDTIDCVITGFEQKSRLTDEAKATITDKDEFGRSKRGHRQSDRELVEEVGNVLVTTKDGVEFGAMYKKGSPVRTMITWENKETFLNKHVEVEYQACGTIDKPRMGRIIRLRPDLD